MTLDDLQSQKDRIDRDILRATLRILKLRQLVSRLIERRDEIDRTAWSMLGQRLSS